MAEIKSSNKSKNTFLKILKFSVAFLIVLALVSAVWAWTGATIFGKNYSGIFNRQQTANILLDDDFAKDYHNDKYKEFLAMGNRIAGYASDIDSFRNNTEGGLAELDKPGEDLILRAFEAANLCGQNIIDLNETVSLFTKTTDQFINFEDLEKQFEIAKSNLGNCESELGDIISSSENEEHKSKYWRVKDKIREAKGLFLELETDIENRYEIVKRRKEARDK